MMCPSTSVRYTRHLYEFLPSGNENRIGTKTEPCGTQWIIFMCEEDSLHYTYMKKRGIYRKITSELYQWVWLKYQDFITILFPESYFLSTMAIEKYELKLYDIWKHENIKQTFRGKIHKKSTKFSALKFFKKIPLNMCYIFWFK